MRPSGRCEHTSKMTHELSSARASVLIERECWVWITPYVYSKTSLNRTLLFQKVVRFSKISVYTKCRIAPANRTKFGSGGGFSDMSDGSSKPNKVRISAGAVERGYASKWTCKPNMKARKMQANLNIVQIAPRLTKICSVYMKARKLIRTLFG